MRCCGYLLQPLCRRRLLALICSVVCIFAASLTTFAPPPPPYCPSLLCEARFCGYVLRPLCRHRLLALHCSVACVVAAISCHGCVAAFSLPLLDQLHAFLQLSPATFVPRLYLLCCMRCCGYLAAISCDGCVAAFFLPLRDLLHAFLRLSRATVVSPPSSCPWAICCMRCCGYLLRPLRPSRFLPLLFPLPCPFFARRVLVHQRCLGSSSAL